MTPVTATAAATKKREGVTSFPKNAFFSAVLF
jgi:hypothetical protein